MKTMTGKERFVAAIHGREVDYVPMVIDFWENYMVDARTGEKRVWHTEEERLQVYQAYGWDTTIKAHTYVSPSKEVTATKRLERDGTVLHQKWETPAGTIEERLSLSEDWPEARNAAGNVPLGHDFRTPRYIEWPFKDDASLETLPYLFPEHNPHDEEAIAKDVAAKKALAQKYGVPLMVYVDSGMDWLTWLFPADQTVFTVMDSPDKAKRILDTIAAAKRQRLEFLLSLGVDAVIRRGWYESTDLWSPGVFREFAVPNLVKEIDMTHAHGTGFIYLMVTGIMSLLPDLAALGFDCLAGPEPVLTGQSQKIIRESLPNKSIFGGISGPEHLSRGTPETIAAALEDSFAIMGKRGFILGPCVGFRHNWPWENLFALDAAWKKLR